MVDRRFKLSRSLDCQYPGPFLGGYFLIFGCSGCSVEIMSWRTAWELLQQLHYNNRPSCPSTVQDTIVGGIVAEQLIFLAESRDTKWPPCWHTGLSVIGWPVTSDPSLGSRALRGRILTGYTSEYGNFIERQRLSSSGLPLWGVIIDNPLEERSTPHQCYLLSQTNSTKLIVWNFPTKTKCPELLFNNSHVSLIL
jgi:hypothetical protein